MKLVIVESPTKAKTIGQFLKGDYKVESSYGHIRDLPKSSLGIDVEHEFEPKYVIPRKSQKRVTELRKEAAKAEKVIIASDEDREGEAIAWHLVRALKLEEDEKGRVERIAFHEITKPAIEAALNHPREINEDLVDAQQARRVLDRLVGYKLSPFLWKKIMGHLSAGRVQSAALKLIVDREEEVRRFKPEEYWTVGAVLFPAGRSKDKFPASVSKIDGQALPKTGIKADMAKKIAADLEKAQLAAKTVEKKEVRRNPLPPFTTSTLQQEASRRLRYSAKQTMRLAQNLYEKGLITYMRTDSLNLSTEATAAAKDWIEEKLGRDYASSAPRHFKAKSRLAQEAHEAIRPTSPSLEEVSTEDAREKKLYDLIWRRFIASQLPPAIFDSRNAIVSAKGEQEYELKANGTTMKFDGFLKIWPTKFEETELPEFKAGDAMELAEIKPEQHFTEPPARYNDASLIKALEEYGIGRPSTYAPTLSLLQERNYVAKNKDRRFEPTEIGELVNKALVENFPEIVDINFTAKMEENLDEVAEGKADWRKIIGDFYADFAPKLEQKYAEAKELKPEVIETDEKCEKCGKPMVIKFGRFGKFLACSGFPECKNTKSLPNPKNETNITCPKCGQGQIVVKKTKKGRIFYGCNRWPDCDFASWKKPEQEAQN
ncbi:MAG: type I DNA topoisomerase [Patescibacteria group bacterium]|nr:type I DNA topoisomerase [Patescibacteria group bacterium]